MARESTISVSLTPRQLLAVKSRVQSGDYESVSEVVRDSLRKFLGKLPPADPLAVLHRSLSAWWWLLELWPKPYVDTATQPPRRSLQLHLGRRRPVPENAEIHPSVMTRIRSLVTYRPANLPTRLLG